MLLVWSTSVCVWGKPLQLSLTPQVGGLVMPPLGVHEQAQLAAPATTGVISTKWGTATEHDTLFSPHWERTCSAAATAT